MGLDTAANFDLAEAEHIDLGHIAADHIELDCNQPEYIVPAADKGLAAENQPAVPDIDLVVDRGLVADSKFGQPVVPRQ